MKQFDYDRLYVIPHIASLSQSGAITDYHGYVQKLGQRLSQQGLTYTKGTMWCQQWNL